MRNFFCLFVITFIFCTEKASAQRDTAKIYMKTIAGTPSTEVVVDNKDSADFIRFIMPPDSTTGKKLFPVADYYFNGKLKMMGTSTNFTAFINLEGKCIEFYPNGRKKIIWSYDKRGIVGDMFQFYSNGATYISGSFVEGGFNLVACNDSTGKALAENGNGIWMKYDKDLKNIIEEGPVVNGKENGEWRGRFNDTVSYSCIYKDGDFISGTSYDNKGNHYSFKNIKVEPEFLGGMDGLGRFLSKNVRYPQYARNHKIQGRVVITFIIEKDGSVRDIKVSKSMEKSLDDEALRVIKMCPKWSPGYLYGIPVRIQYAVPINFTLAPNNLR